MTGPVGFGPTAHHRVVRRAARDRCWRWATLEDVALAERYGHGNLRTGETAVMWGMLCHAVRVSAIADRAPPRPGYPTVSLGAWLAADDVTWWQRVSAALRGETEDLPETAPGRTRVEAVEIALRDEVLEVWHLRALSGLGDWRRLRKAVFALASGLPPRAVQEGTGLSRDRLRHARERAVADMLDAW